MQQMCLDGGKCMCTYTIVCRVLFFEKRDVSHIKCGTAKDYKCIGVKAESFSEVKQKAAMRATYRLCVALVLPVECMAYFPYLMQHKKK